MDTARSIPILCLPFQTTIVHLHPLPFFRASHYPSYHLSFSTSFSPHIFYILTASLYPLFLLPSPGHPLLMRLPTLLALLLLLPCSRDIFLNNFFLLHTGHTPLPDPERWLKKTRTHVVPASVGVEEGKEGDDRGESGYYLRDSSCR
jgi:hypothetical protein